MPLILPRPNYGLAQNNLPATPNQTGVTVTAGSANTKGSYTEIVSSLTYDIEGFYVLILNSTTSASAETTLADIAIGGAGSEQVVIANMPVSNTGTFVAYTRNLYIPLALAKGSRVAVRAQSNTGSNTSNWYFWFVGGSNLSPIGSYYGVDTFGANTSTSTGTLHTAGNTGTESSWASIGSTTTRDLRALLVIPSGDGSITTYNSIAYHIEVGYSSTTLAEWFMHTVTNETFLGPSPSMPIPCFVPSGTQLQIRAEASGTAQQLSFVVLGFY